MYRVFTTFKAVALLFLIAWNTVTGQMVVGYRYGSGVNPAVAGASGTGKLILDYTSTYPGSGYNLNSFGVSFDTFLEFAHGGAGFTLLSDHPGGLLTDIRAMFAYSYHSQISRDLYLFAGMNAGFIFRSINRSELIFPDQIDPLTGVSLPGNEVIDQPSEILFDMGTGFLVSYRNTSLSINAMHLFQPDFSAGEFEGAVLPRMYNMNIFSRFETGNKELFLIPYFQVSTGGGITLLAGGGAAEFGKIGLGVLGIYEQSGFNIQTTVKAGVDNLDFLYSFRFSIIAENAGLPIALVHQLGIRLSLNIVDKRNTIRTINLPDL